MEINKEQAATITIDRCASLGLREDPQTALGFPSIWNYCHKARPAAPVALAYQGNFCQVSGHRQCLLLQENGGRRLPPEARSHSSFASGMAQGRGLFLFILLLSFLAGLSLWFWANKASIFPLRISPVSILISPTSAGASAPQASPATDAAVIATSSPTAAILPGGEGSTTLSVPSPAVQMCGYKLDQTIHAERDFIIHRAAGGENINGYATEYQTSVEAILAANFQLPVPLHIDWVLVIPVGTRDLPGQPPFEPYFETAQGRGLKELASNLSIEEPVLRRYNGINTECTAISGWLLIPRFPSP